jgi:RNA polymerase sigma-70 factor (ECF subfamily)
MTGAAWWLMAKDAASDEDIPRAEPGIIEPHRSSVPTDHTRFARSMDEGMAVNAVESSANRPGGRTPRPLEWPELPPFTDVAREHLDRLYGFCVRLTGDPSDAEDLVQETLLRAMRAYGDLREPSRAKGWLFAIATNTWRDLFRARGRQVTTIPLEGLDPDGDEFSLFQTIAIEDPFPYSDELHLDFLRLFGDEDVSAVFGSITPAFRLPLILTVVHGFSCKEAAAILHVPLGTLLSRLHRGRKQLERGLWDYAVANGLVITTDEDQP